MSRVACVLKVPAVEVAEQVEPATYEWALEDGFALPVEGARSTDFVALKKIVNCVVVPEQRHCVDASLVLMLRVMGCDDWAVVKVAELDVCLSVKGKASLDELLGGLLHGVGRNSTLVVCQSPGR